MVCQAAAKPFGDFRRTRWLTCHRAIEKGGAMVVDRRP
jgi:hypothetical protein